MPARDGSFHHGVWVAVLLTPVRWAFVLILVLAGTLLAAWIIDWICVFHLWPRGVERLREILSLDLGHALEIEARQGLAPGFVTGVANGLHDVVFGWTGIRDMGVRFASVEPLSIADTIVRRFWVANAEAIEVAMVGTQLLGVRLATVGLWLPVLGLCYSVGMADGLAQRAVRRSGAGRESAGLYHRAKFAQVWLLGIGGLVVLLVVGVLGCAGVPFSGSLLLGVLARVQWCFYKKRL